MQQQKEKDWVWDSRPVPGVYGKMEVFKRFIEQDQHTIKPKENIKTNTVSVNPSFKRETKRLATSGIYLIVCEIEKCVYVGQSVNVESRLRSHKMAIRGKVKNLPKNYTRIVDHYKKHGIEAFQFISYLSIPFATQTSLLEKENDTMVEFVRKGYRLYNTSVNITVSADSIYCPDKYRPIVSSLVNVLTENNIQQVVDLIKSINE